MLSHVKLFIADGHLDISYNAVHFGIMPEMPLSAVSAMRPPYGGTPSLCFETMREAGLRLVFATIFVQPGKRDDHEDALRQLSLYQRLEAEGLLRIVRRASDLPSGTEDCEGDEPVSAVILMEGATPVVKPEHVEFWYAQGVRSIAPVWTNNAFGADCHHPDEGFSQAGFALLSAMDALGTILDFSHLSPCAIRQALDSYNSPVMASHSNAQAVSMHNRNLPDDIIKGIAARSGFIGAVLFNPFIRAGYERFAGHARPSLDEAAVHIAHILRIMDGKGFAGIGSDTDGGFGHEDLPCEMAHGYSGLPRLYDAMLSAGIPEQTARAVMGANLLAFAKNALP